MENLVDRLAGTSATEAPFKDLFAANAFVRCILSLLSVVYTLFFIKPLALIYLKGPRIMGFGMWSGMDAADICAELTGVSAIYWDKERDVCLSHIEKKFDAFVIGVSTLIVVALTYRICAWLWYLYVVEPVKMRRKLALLREHSDMVVRLYSQRQSEDHHLLES